MKTQQLRTLVAIADAGSVRGAARLLNSSPAAITQSLQLLEKSVQMQLLSRTPSGVTLTASGRTLLSHARLIVSQMTRAHEALDALRGNTRKRLSVAVTAWVTLTFLPETITRFRERMPQIQLELFEGLLSIANPRLRDGSLDIYVGRQKPGATSSEFTYEPLFASSLAVVARRDHPHAENRSLADLLDLDWLVVLDPETEGHASYRMFEKHGLPVPNSIHYVHSLTVAVALLRRTDMVSIFPWPLIELCAEPDGLCALPLREQLDDSMAGIIMRSGEPEDAASRCFIECLLETVRAGKWMQSPEIRRAMHTVDILI